jgi:hypothetical protein
VPADDEDELQWLQKRRNVLKQRLHMLKLRRDRQGDETPAHVLIEIEETQREIDLVEVKLRLPQINPRVAATVTNADPLLAIAQLGRILTDRMEAGLAEMARETRGLASQVQFLAQSHRAAEDWRNSISAEVQQLGGDRKKDQRSRTWGRRIQVFILALVLIILSILIWWFFVRW